MKKACIFDFDGVMIDSERLWEDEQAKTRIYQNVYGEEVAAKLQNKTLGLNMDAIHKLAQSYGSMVPVKNFHDACDNEAIRIYANAPLTKGLEDLIEALRASRYLLGIVSASPKSWIDVALNRLSNKQIFTIVISLHERDDLAHKPAPDGYLEAMKILGVTPKETIVIEDSNTGIQSAKAAGAFTIGLKQNHPDGYTIEGADAYVDNIVDVISYIKEDYAKSG